MGQRVFLVGCLVVLAASACSDTPPGKTYFERNILPILSQKCAGNTSGCHSTNATDPYAFAAGNLDVTSYTALSKRRDVLTRFGAYPYPLLLIKAVAPSAPDPTDPNRLEFQYGVDSMGNPFFRPLEILHAGGGVISVGSDAFYTLQTWLQNGATENGLAPPTPRQTGNGQCSTSVPEGFATTTLPTLMMNPKYSAGFDAYKSNVQPIFDAHGCTSSNCHGAPQSDFYITCGSDDTQLAFNFSQAWSFVNSPVDDSQLLRVPLAVNAGGRGHTGGDQFPSTDDGDYKTIHDWAQQLGLLQFAQPGTPQQFFQDNVQPIFVARGCSFEACHSPDATNDFKLRSGTQGFFSAVALAKNYDLARNQFLAIEFPDVRRGRAVAKTILANDLRLADQVGGIAHRGGPVLETPLDPANPTHTGVASDPAQCGAFVPFTAGQTQPSSPFCAIQEWIRLERAAVATQLSPMNQNDKINIVYVDRATGDVRDRLQFDTFVGNSDLKYVEATFGANFGQQLSVTGTPTSLLTNCAGLAGGTADIQAPDVALDGDHVAFAARTDAGSPLGVWVVSIATGACAQVTPNSGMIHNFDPAWAPDGSAIVFASTRGKPGNGPTLSRKRFLPQSDLWRVSYDLTAGTVGAPEQMTFLSNSEISPQFMREGRVTMTTEKVSDGFYQLSGRRLNWDLTDYHPLLAQRKQSLYFDPTNIAGPLVDSIGSGAATDIREGSDGSFLIILSDPDANTGALPAGSAGMLATFNRSIGPFEKGRTTPGYLGSVNFINPSSLYRAPVTMPDGQIMASFTPAGTPAWKIVAVNPRTGAQSDLIVPGAGRMAVDAVLAYKYPARALYLNRRQLVFGGSTMSDKAHAIVHMPDAPMVFTMLTGNLRRGRPVDAFRGAKQIAIYSEGFCPSGACSANTNGIYQNRALVGTVPLADDGSFKMQVPAGTGVILELQDGGGSKIVTMGEEHQLGPGEQITLGIREQLFDAVCGGCHGSVTGKETDIAVTADALTGASASTSALANPVVVGP